MNAREEGFKVLCTPDADLCRQHGFSRCDQQGHDERAMTLFTQKWEKRLFDHVLHPLLTPTYGGYSANIAGLL